MDLDDNNVQRRIVPLSIDVHPTEKAIVVNYELEASILDDLGDTMLEESKECQKIIRLKSLNESTNIDTLASEIIKKCELISPSKHDELRTLLNYLRTRKDPSLTRPQTAVFNERMKANINSNSNMNDMNQQDKPQSPQERQQTPPASISQLDEYIELLYEELNDKIKASWLISQLARIPDNLIELTSNETLLGALARVLREDGKKSLDLSANIIYIFAYFSNFKQFHSIIIQFKVGSICFDLMEHELNREEIWLKELNDKKDLLDKDSSYSLPVQSDYEKSLKKYQLLIKKQNPMLRVSVYLLLNLSEDSKVECKMVNKSIINLLCKALERDSQDLLILVVTFLHKLSIYLENKNQMKELKVIEKITPLLAINNEHLIKMTLKLMHNLMLDIQLKNQMLKLGLFPKLISFLNKERHQQQVLLLLYQISRDDECKSLFNSPEIMSLIMNRILKHATPQLPLELISLAINLTINRKNAQLICDHGHFPKLVDRAFKNNDSLLFKMLRNISYHDDPIKMLFLDYHQKMAELIIKSDLEEVVIECLAILGNLTLPHQINWESLFKKHNIMNWIKSKVKPGQLCEDDLILEMVILIGTASSQKECALYLLDEDVIKILINLLNAKQEDDEMILQLVYAFHMLMKHSEARDVVIKNAQVADYLIDLMHDKNNEIKKVCNATLDLIAENDQEWAEKIKMEKFCSHNKQWLEMIQSRDAALDEIDDNQSGELELSNLSDEIAYPNVLLKTDLLYDSSSDTPSDMEHSLHLSIQGMALNSSSPLNNTTSPVLISSNNNIPRSVPALSVPSSRPHTGYKRRK